MGHSSSMSLFDGALMTNHSSLCKYLVKFSRHSELLVASTHLHLRRIGVTPFTL